MRRTPAYLTILFVSTSLMAACEGSPMNCISIVSPSIVMEIRDSISGAGVATQARTVVTDGAFADTLVSGDSVHQSVVNGRPGTYTITVSHPGYTTWSRSNVMVQNVGCSVQMVNVKALLQP